MSLRHHARTGIALAAAYAVALQAILLAVAAPAAGAAGISPIPLCAGASTGHSAPAGHPGNSGQDCLDACLTGCCGAVPVCPGPAGAIIYEPARAPHLAPALAKSPHMAVRVGNAHRSRAPPIVFPD